MSPVVPDVGRVLLGHCLDAVLLKPSDHLGTSGQASSCGSSQRRKNTSFAPAALVSSSGSAARIATADSRDPSHDQHATTGLQQSPAVRPSPGTVRSERARGPHQFGHGFNTRVRPHPGRRSTRQTAGEPAHGRRFAGRAAGDRYIPASARRMGPAPQWGSPQSLNGEFEEFHCEPGQSARDAAQTPPISKGGKAGPSSRKAGLGEVPRPAHGRSGDQKLPSFPRRPTSSESKS